ncbi:S-adenosyl-L-methionine-dependent methyltransferase [Rhodocollybia butyracea]|uniref:DNA (cytosine-5-)-methyltransferase n=1 Tax=Rhodocollybia butyracea TaxID=206335 RepID=A0A9P5P7G1_9AGAR|nr:S-adenosyl-L-methionine-dependent methyltransferase [Rhodocollybia butyracea]
MLISPPCQGFSKANPGGKNDEKNRSAVDVVPNALKKFGPAYMVGGFTTTGIVPLLTMHSLSLQQFYENVPHQISARHVHTIRQLEYEVLNLGYSLTYRILNASHYGVPSSRKRLIVIAAAQDRPLPAWPVPTHGGEGKLPVQTLRDAIGDLQWDNPTCIKDTKNNKGDARVDHPEDRFQAVANHCTGCSNRNVRKWDEEDTIPLWDEPISTIRTQPTDRWTCRHPNFTNRILTVREMARAMSFPDYWRFKGSTQNQYKQVGNSVPPKLAEAVAQEIKKALCASHSGIDGGAEDTESDSEFEL